MKHVVWLCFCFYARACRSWAIFAHVVDLLFFVDMMISFDTAYWDDGNIITSRRASRPQFPGFPSLSAA